VTTTKTFLIDAGTGNLHSVDNALRALGYEIIVTQDPKDLQDGGRVILPGVGAFGKFVEGLSKNGLDKALRACVQKGDPLLGICVGMQALFQVGEEKGLFDGLGIIQGRVIRFPEDGNKVPQTGWNQLWFTPGDPLLSQILPGAYTYFNHSYYCQPESNSDILIETDYGIRYASGVSRKNVYGVQFHPEKSQKVGLQILKNFLSL
jgi:imidazole glycerol-phosphate synthase subunit HisH